MIVTIHQPAYLPWLGYFDKIARSDIFVFLDTVQLEIGRSYVNRNQIKTVNGPTWLTIPVLRKGRRAQTIAQTETDPQMPWRQKHLRAINFAYARAPRFNMNFQKIEKLFSSNETLLAEICYQQLAFWVQELGIKTQIVRASALPEMGKKSDLILNICRYFGARRYISGKLGRSYLNETDFRQSNIDIEYQDYKHPTYPQLYGDFVPNLSIVDFWMNSNNPTEIWDGK
jgi:hypothetical protein